MDGMLEQYRGIEQEKDEEVQSAPSINAHSIKRNRGHTLRGNPLLLPFQSSLPIDAASECSVLQLSNTFLPD